MRRLGPCFIGHWPEFNFRPLDQVGVEHAMIIGATWAQETIDSLIAEHYPGKKQGFTLVSLVTPGQTIPEHTDHRENCRTRVHVPLTTDELCVFVSEGREHHMPVGSAYLIDPTISHGVIHRGTKDRIHLMFNVGD